MITLRRHNRSLALAIGAGFVTAWTLVRSFSNGVNFDVVGQIGVALQWTHGMHDGAQFGATNYLLKIPLYLAVNLLGLGPHQSIIGLALICNLLTFGLLCWLGTRLLRAHSMPFRAWHCLVLIWLASISERVFWLDYANSRNLEVAGGIAVLVFGLLLLQRPSKSRAIWLGLLSGLVFFADQLQLTSIAAGLVLYAVILAVRYRHKRQVASSLLLIGTLLVGFILSRLIKIVAIKLLPISFLVAPTARDALSLHSLGTVASGVLSSTAAVFDIDFWHAGSGLNALRQLVCLALLSILVVVTLYGLYRGRQRRLSLALLCCILTSYLAYIVSGQALVAGTYRYLIMVPVLFAFLALLHIPRSPLLRYTSTVVAGLLVVSGLLCLGALVVTTPQRFEKDQPITVMLDYVQAHDYKYAIGSRDGLVASYFARDRTIIAPYICVPGDTLQASDLFFDSAGFSVPAGQTVVPVLIPSGGIVSSGQVCDQAAITAQLGTPLAQQPIPGYGTALLYLAQHLPK